LNLFETITQEISGQNAYDLTGAITQFYRSPGSGGYHAATGLARNRLLAAGLQVEETQYPLDGKTVVLDRTMPMAWEPYDAKVRVVSPTQELIVDFDRAASCLAWWSRPTPRGGLEAELIDVGTGEREEDFAGKNLVGNIAYVHNANWHITWSKVSESIAQRGAKGIITDFFLYPTPPIRTRERVPEAVQLLRLEFNATRKFDFWACSVDYPTGQKIEQWLKLGPVRVHADIQCDTYAGYGQNILATIPGKTHPEESVFILAHSSAGSRPGANCASGTSLLVETARALNALIGRGALPRPKRSIKFLVVSEGLGSYNYIDAHPDEVSRIKASYCLESVGHSQRKVNTTLYYSRAPDSTPSFVNDHFDAVLERLPKQWGWVGRNEPDISPIVVSQVPYTPWSDNSTWAAHGIPSALFMSWPDEYFHSQLLTADVTDPSVFAYAGAMVAAAAYEVANAGLAEALWLAEWMYSRSAARLYREKQQAAWETGTEEDNAWTALRLEYLCARDRQALASLGALVDAAGQTTLAGKIAAVQQQLAVLKEQLLPAQSSNRAVASAPAAPGLNLTSIPHKLKRISTPGLAGMKYLDELALRHALEQQDAHFTDYVLKPATDEMWNRCDGQRSIAEIVTWASLQFNLRVNSETWLPVFAGWEKSVLIAT
jgi:hypothetical protein